MIKKVVLKVISFYQKYISFGLGKNCRFYPSCSEYAATSIEKYGVFTGTLKGIKRILKCHPFNKGGVDLP
jgi:hypothetical protein